jgi:hypothetical protein
MLLHGANSCAESPPTIVSLSLGYCSGVTLAWDVNSEPNTLATSRITARRRENPRALTSATRRPPRPRTQTATTYFFKVTAYNTAALESKPSNEVSYETAPLGAHPHIDGQQRER